jgi:hypothetical protein
MDARSALLEQVIEEGPMDALDQPEPNDLSAFRRSHKVGLHDFFMDLKTHQIRQLHKLSKWRRAFECKLLPSKCRRSRFKRDGAFGGLRLLLINRCVALSKLQEQTESDTRSYLLTLYYTTVIWVSTQLSACKTAFDQYASQFGELVFHAEKYLKNNTTERLVFAFDFGVIPSLYFASSECRVPSTRRKALALLRLAPKKESLLAADNMAELCDRLITIEEGGLGLPGKPKEQIITPRVDDLVLPRAHERVHMLRVFRNEATRSFELRVIRQSEVDGCFQSRAEHFSL